MVKMEINQNTAERVIRVVGGVGLAAAGLLWVRGWLGVLLALVGAVLIFSGSVGFCHVKQALRIGGAKRR